MLASYSLSIAEPIHALLLAQGTIPRYDGMDLVNLLARVLHILAAVILVGGLFYMRTVLAPRGEAGNDAASSDPWFAGHRGKWAMWVGIASLLLIVTGLYNYLRLINNYERMASSYHMLAGIKMLLGLALMFLASVLSGRSGTAEQFRSKMKFWLNICLAISILVITLGAVLRSYPRTEKLNSAGAGALIAPANN